MEYTKEDLQTDIDWFFDNDIGAMEACDYIKYLLKKGLNPESNALRTIGYKEIIGYLRGKLTLDETLNRIKQRTRNFAKRQVTWFSKIPDLHWYNSEDPKIIRIIIERFELICVH